ncbi:MAG: GlmU family protein [Chitinophagales bacterium]|nr:GlmU family protein [Chitinophagales bacterium]
MTMQSVFLFDFEHDWLSLQPLTLTKAISKLRIGITTIQEKWEVLLYTNCSALPCASYLNEENLQGKTDSIFINASIIPNQILVNEILALKQDESLWKENVLIAANGKNALTNASNKKEYRTSLLKISYPWDLFSLNDVVLRQDFEQITKGRKSAALSETNIVIGSKEAIFLEEGAKVEAAVLNTTTGPIYIGKDAEIMEGSVVRGGLALCEGAALKLSTKIYGATTVGPHSKVGGEVNNSVIQGFSNKGHDGFLGNSVIGEWCNLGADTNNSNLKNNYGKVSVYNYAKKDYINSGLQFLGLIMGDHSKCGINTMFNTGTVVGVFANVFGGGFPPKYIPSFAWGGADGFETYKLEKAFEVAERVMERRHIELTEKDKAILTHVFNSEE